MQLHNLRNPLKRKIKRVGRGGKRGTTSGRGQKGQKARAGHRIRPAERDLLLRLPKLRGVKNKPRTAPSRVINVGVLARHAEGGAVNPDVLLKKNFIKDKRERVKILGGGELKSALSVSGIRVSASARAKIEKAGGSVK
ncbi:MAG: 50S ribosomal protein L15 [Candidatus Jorgensenbacteria bacterium GW2011_GWA1_48_13]|uniref:Large ribosomal subunit protein uL15 n=2 Tax=Candidatus Joergenseniibacteriota TaxID=1752739 RepID=A0A0G1W8J0_9BACT|nr:MAG: 50S ribosomal protein L15 [Candidatus Jorgensenbacteria bacterium GW2011_GWA1_48_13]KKU99290.1 MAG: 50S ribosomal protein L15 [Candidatus Jorgensenbacteria bacterium GW2011_GWC1_48_8]KKW14970.1 MAG: 50S ribosomal protein L15 [Candidatus Jorgensenbacteria bacterium GW2011_GWB1_50_10]